MEGRKLKGMIMVELDGGGQMPYTPREAAEIAHDWLAGHGVPMKASYTTTRFIPRDRPRPAHRVNDGGRVTICPNSSG